MISLFKRIFGLNKKIAQPAKEAEERCKSFVTTHSLSSSYDAKHAHKRELNKYMYSLYLVEVLSTKLDEAIEKENYEMAAILRDRIKAIQK